MEPLVIQVNVDYKAQRDLREPTVPRVLRELLVYREIQALLDKMVPKEQTVLLDILERRA
jgi:hypothetical protein